MVPLQRNKGSFQSESKVGVGLRNSHYPDLESNPKTQVDWFEAISENYMDSEGRPRRILRWIREHYPMSLHGVSMCLASAEGLDQRYLKTLKSLIDEIEPFVVSDHLCWAGNAHARIPDLLPFPYTEESYGIILKNVLHAQEVLKRPIALENVSTYMSFKSSEMNEAEFLSRLVKDTDCKLLLDINNVYVSAQNLNFDACDYLDLINPDWVAQIHLAGFTDTGEFLFDTHSHPVYPPVWDLFEYYIQKKTDIPFMIEWDEDVPGFSRLEEEALKAKRIWEKYAVLA